MYVNAPKILFNKKQKKKTHFPLAPCPQRNNSSGVQSKKKKSDPFNADQTEWAHFFLAKLNSQFDFGAGLYFNFHLALTPEVLSPC